jgi:hypothetical protein
MKKIFFAFMICIFAMVQANAQNNYTNVSKLMTAKRFAFVVTKIQSRPVYVTAYDSYILPSVTATQMNLSFLAQTQIAAGKASNYDQYNYVSQINMDHNYYNAYGIEQYPKIKDRYHTTTGQAVFMIQLPDGVLVNGDGIPANIKELADDNFYAYQEKDVKAIIEAKNEQWKLTYTLGNGKDKRKLELKVSKDGSAVLKESNPSGKDRKYLYGYIQDSQSLQYSALK